MNIMETIENFFKKNNHAISINELYKKLKISEKEKELFLDALYELEKAGKILFQDNMYFKVPYNSDLYHGKLKISNKGNFYITIEDNHRINIKNYRQYKLKKDDVIYVVKKENNDSKNIIKNILKEILLELYQKKIFKMINICLKE